MRELVTIVHTDRAHLRAIRHHVRAARTGRSQGGRAHAAIVGGTRIGVAQAPWQVAVIGVIGKEEFLICGGSILSETEIVTAGHCVYNPHTKAPLAPGQIVVVAGSSDFAVIEPEEQETLASAVRVHPSYSYTAPLPEPDDVAVVTLKTALHFDSVVQKIGIAAAAFLPEGTAVNLTGFGTEEPERGELNGTLNSLGMTTRYSAPCGGQADAVFVCATSAQGSLCFGDSGSGLTLPGAPQTLVGVADTVQGVAGHPCAPGALGGFVNLAAPEIHDFITGSLSPPVAPRGGGASMHGGTTVGETLTCEPGNWTGEPTFTYRFVDTATLAVLQQGASSSYQPTHADVGRTIGCEVLAANSGGTGVSRTAAFGPIRPDAAEEEARKRAEEEAARKRAEEEARKRAEEEAARKRAEEAAARKAAEEAAARKTAEEASRQSGGGQGVQGFQSVSAIPDAELASASLKANKKGVVTVHISCPTGESACEGTLVLRTVGAVAARHKAVLTLAEASFSVPGGTSATVRLHLSRRARSLLARKGSLLVRVTITAHDAAGATHTAVTTVTLHAARKH